MDRCFDLDVVYRFGEALVTDWVEWTLHPVRLRYPARGVTVAPEVVIEASFLTVM